MENRGILSVDTYIINIVKIEAFQPLLVKAHKLAYPVLSYFSSPDLLSQVLYNLASWRHFSVSQLINMTD